MVAVVVVAVVVVAVVVGGSEALSSIECSNVVVNSSPVLRFSYCMFMRTATGAMWAGIGCCDDDGGGVY